MTGFKSKFARSFRLYRQVTEWLVVKNLTTDKTDSLRDKSLFWGGISILLSLSDAQVEQLFILKFDPELNGEVLSFILLILSTYFSIHWLKSIQSDVIHYSTNYISDLVLDVAAKLEELRTAQRNLGSQFGLDVRETTELKNALDRVDEKQRQFMRLSSYRNLLFWITDVLPVPIMLSYNLYLFFSE